ncbi:MAG: D-alanyl-D-alanine carboxypeptidase [Actinomycetota bacterium]|nr:D-alanyl-D-alanine carboxypeptidase [Actinomycetota bacterium]
MRRIWLVSIIVLLLAGACSPDATRGSGDRAGRQGKRHQAGEAPAPQKKQDGAQPGPSPSLGDAPPAATEDRDWWKTRIDRLLKRKPFSVQVRLDGEAIYSSASHNDRVPASVQKLALSMALFDKLDPATTFPTKLLARHRRKAVIEGDLWVLGSGDPTLGGNPHFLSDLPKGATDIQELVRALRREGVEEISGNVMGATGPFARDWYAPGWRPYFPSSEVGLPTALAFNGNVFKQRYTKNPERVLAENLRKRLRRAGIEVTGGAGSGPPPRRLRPIASVASPRLSALVGYMNRRSSNFFAEILGKRLGEERFGAPGTITKGARAIMSFAQSRGVAIEAYDSSGLSYDNRMEAAEIARLIEAVEKEPWVEALRNGLAGGGEGTLEDRLHDVRVRAKTGTLVGVSALAGWVWLEKARDWAEFAVISRGLDKSSAVRIEDAIVRKLHRYAR